uniref:Uncharacterized protein n=1 Tax=viral metagenome TaxID=1070528 RepID=A0A6C0HA99_9ZZZZ
MSIKKRNMKKSKKKYHMMGGADPINDKIPHVIYESDLKQKMKSRHGGLLALILTLATILSSRVQYVITTAKNTIGTVLGINMSSITDVNLKEFLAKKISELRDLLNDPLTQKNLREIAEKMGVYGGIAINVATPAIKQAMPQIIEITFEGADLLGRSLIKLALDLAGTLPIVGTAIEGVRVIDDTVKSGEAMIDANLQIVEKVTDSYGDFLKKFMDLIPSSDQLTPAYLTSLIEKEKALARSSAVARPVVGGGIKRALEIKKRIKKSIARFHRTSKRKTKRHKKIY